MTHWIGRLRRLDAWLAGGLLRPATTGCVMVACIAGFALAGLAVLIGIKFTQDVFKDNAEAYAWGRQLLGGYGRHPPLTGWIARFWYSLFPASDWASYLLSRLLVFVSLTSIYFVTRRTLDARRAALVVFAMMLYPLFIGVKSDRLNNYQVLLALLPLLIWTFLIAYERCTAKSGALLGLVAGAAALTIYSAALGLVAVVLAAVVHPARGRFFGSPAPYVAMLAFLVVISPHLVWLVEWNFPPLHWVGDQLNTGTQLRDSIRMVVHQTGLVAIPVVIAALALLPWRLRPAARPPALTSAPKPDAILVLVIAAVLLAVPTLASIPLKVKLKHEWGDSLFFVVPTALLILAPWLAVRRRAVTRLAVTAAIATAIYMVAAPFYALTHFKGQPGYDAYTPSSELARAVTRLWHERFAAPLPIVVSNFEIAAPIVFYSSDHPRMFADSPDEPRIFAADQPTFSPWIDYPADLRRLGFVGICHNGDKPCLDYLARLDPRAEALDVTVVREVAGIKATPWTFRVRIARPQ